MIENLDLINLDLIFADKTEVEHERVSSQRVASQNFISEREDKSKMEEVSTLKRSEPFIEIQMQTVSNSVRQRDRFVNNFNNNY